MIYYYITIYSPHLGCKISSRPLSLSNFLKIYLGNFKNGLGPKEILYQLRAVFSNAMKNTQKLVVNFMANVIERFTKLTTLLSCFHVNLPALRNIISLGSVKLAHFTIGDCFFTQFFFLGPQSKATRMIARTQPSSLSLSTSWPWPSAAGELASSGLQQQPNLPDFDLFRLKRGLNVV